MKPDEDKVDVVLPVVQVLVADPMHASAAAGFPLYAWLVVVLLKNKEIHTMIAKSRCSHFSDCEVHETVYCIMCLEKRELMKVSLHYARQSNVALFQARESLAESLAHLAIDYRRRAELL